MRRAAYQRKTKPAPRVWVDIVRPDWAALINELTRAGYPKQQISQAANTTREVVYSMLRGNTPAWDVGQAVLRLVEVARAEPQPNLRQTGVF